jgi:hypothetical protein
VFYYYKLVLTSTGEEIAGFSVTDKDYLPEVHKRIVQNNPELDGRVEMEFVFQHPDIEVLQRYADSAELKSKLNDIAASN